MVMQSRIRDATVRERETSAKPAFSCSYHSVPHPSQTAAKGGAPTRLDGRYHTNESLAAERTVRSRANAMV